MTKRDLIDEIVRLYPVYSRRDAEVIVNSVFESMTEALCRGNRIEIRGFGSFVVKERQAREGRNPKTGEIVAVASKRVPFFKVGKELKNRVDAAYQATATGEPVGAVSADAESDSRF
ncbi:MAG: integration host factor subunit beta [Hyphomicrobiaceae bacterium]|jgi:integration host factor subunit beta